MHKSSVRNNVKVPFDTKTDNINIVEEAMSRMDKESRTQFKLWVRCEDNLESIVYYLRPLIDNYNDNPLLVYRAIRWMTEGWSCQRLSELLIKLFYNGGIDNDKFVAMTENVTQGWSIEDICSLVLTLILGERSKTVAGFVKRLSFKWQPNQTLQLVTCLSSKLRWDSGYFKHFIMHYIELVEREGRVTSMNAERVRERFRARNALLEKAKESRKLAELKKTYSTLLDLSEFGSTVFEIVLLEEFQLKYAADLKSRHEQRGTRRVNPRPTSGNVIERIDLSDLRIDGVHISPGSAENK